MTDMRGGRGVTKFYVLFKRHWKIRWKFSIYGCFRPVHFFVVGDRCSSSDVWKCLHSISLISLVKVIVSNEDRI